MAGKKYKWGGNFMPIVRAGIARGKALNSVEMGLNHNHCELVLKKTHKAQFPLKYKTQFDEVKFILHSTVKMRRYDTLTAGLPPADTNVFETPEFLVWVSKIELPTGYSMDVKLAKLTLKTLKSNKATYPYFAVKVAISIGPMIGKWTNYHKILSWEIRGSGACKLK